MQTSASLNSWRSPAFLVGIANTVLLLMLLAYLAMHLDGNFASSDALGALEPQATDFDFRTRSDAESEIEGLGDSPSANELATALAEIDSWLASENEQDALQAYKLDQVARLRKLIASELAELHKQILQASSGGEAAELYSHAGRLLALYPMDTSHPVLEEARRLAAQQADVGSRIELIRRQRYNVWALDELEQMLTGIDENASSLKTSDNPKTIEIAVQHLGPIDPALLEPVIFQLYEHALEKAQSNVNSDQRREMARRLMEPTTARRGLGDF